MRLSLCCLTFALCWNALGRADELHRNIFTGKSTQFIKGPDNVKAEEKAHELTETRSRSLPTSERIVVNLGAGKAESNYAYYYYPTPPAPLTDELNAEIFLHSNRAGVQLLARVVFPKIRNPKQLDEPLTRLVKLDDYKAPAGGWQKLILKRPDQLLQAQKQALRLELKGDPDVSDAYIDRLVLNLYTAPGEVEVFIDNLEIGPVKEGVLPPPVAAKEVPRPKEKIDPIVPVEWDRNRLVVGGNQVFPRFIRYSGTPMLALKEAGFNALAMPNDAPLELLEDAINNYRFWIVPQIPPISEAHPERPVNPLTARDADTLVAAIRRFQSGDGVLFWDLGAVRSEDYRRVSRTVEAIRAADPRRPIAADVWDGFGRYAIPLQMVGTHRDPLMTSMELDRYGRWLIQRQILASSAKFSWTWIQTHIPDWQVRLLYDRPIGDGFEEPIGPQPEQIRLLTYLALAAGCKGLGFWSDRFLADSTQGRDRLLQMALLNQEIEMLEPILLSLATDVPVRWVDSSHPAVKVAIMRTTGKGILCLPIWLGAGAQYVPPQGAVQGLSFMVPLVPDGSWPWEISPVRVQSLQNNLRMTPEGVQVTLPEFDLTAAVVFTSENDHNGLLAAWQKYVRQSGRKAAAWAGDLAEEQFRKISSVHEQLERLMRPPPESRMWLREAEKHLLDARRARAANNDEAAYMEAIRALRPLRLLARTHWETAMRGIDTPVSTPYAVSFYTLPRHYKLAQLVRSGTFGENYLSTGGFDDVVAGERGAAVTNLPGWSVQEIALDEVVMNARIVSAKEATTPEPKEIKGPVNIYAPTSPAKRVIDPLPPRPNLGPNVLRLTITPKPVVLEKGDKAPPEPQALERVFLGVNSPPIKFTPDSWVRISGWVKLPTPIRASADGAMLFDSATGEAYAIRLVANTDWRQFHTYRKVPANGEIRVRLALTGFGTAYFDNIRVEPLVGPEGKRSGDVSILPIKR